jgi:hypothetical protein
MCNLFHIRRVRVYMHTHVLDMQTQSGRLVSQPVSLGLAEPHGLHALRLRHDTVHGGTPQAGRSRFTGSSILHTRPAHFTRSPKVAR